MNRRTAPVRQRVIETAMRFQRSDSKARIGRLAVAMLALALAWPGAVATAQSSSDATPRAEATPTRCADGQLRVGDLQFLDEEWRSQRHQLNERATAWESDAFLTALQVNCGVLEPGFRWRGTYYSPSAQAFYATDTGRTMGAEFDPEDAAALPADLRFGAVWRALVKAGYADEITLSAAIGVTIQVNSSATPLGPGSVPLDVVVCHVGLEHLGEIRDLFVTVDDGVVYRHTFP